MQQLGTGVQGDILLVNEVDFGIVEMNVVELLFELLEWMF